VIGACCPRRLIRQGERGGRAAPVELVLDESRQFNLYQPVIGLAVHQTKISTCALALQPDGTVTTRQREFGAFKRDRKALAQWAREFGPRWW